jgi:hypothetical protein
MNDLLRLIAVGLMSFAIVGLAMVYSRGGDVSTMFQTVSQNVTGAVGGIGSALTGTASDEPPASAAHTLTIARPKAAAWVGLAGFPDQAEIVFPLPREASYLSGALDLVFDTQLTEHGDGLLTLSVNGTPRGQLVLDSGRHTHNARIELTAADLTGDRVALQMAGRGTTNSGQICPTDAANSGSAITLAGSSRLDLVTATAPADGVGLLLASPGALALRPGPNKGDTALAIWAAQQLARGGIEARVSEGGPGETAVTITRHAVTTMTAPATNMLVGEEAVRAIISASGSPLPAAGPVRVADLGAETLVKSFRGSRRWSIPFAAADLPGGALPERFNVQLKTTPLASGNDWIVRFTLNGNLLEAHRVAGNSDTLSFAVGLPEHRLLPANLLMVELVDSTPGPGPCARPTDAQAQMLPESLLLDTAPATLAWAALIERLAASPVVGLEADGLTLAQARAASDLLSLIVPRDGQVSFDGTAPIVLAMVPRDLAATTLAIADASTQVVVPVTSNAGRSLAVLSRGPQLDDALTRLGTDDVVILVAAH